MLVRLGVQFVTETVLQLVIPQVPKINKLVNSASYYKNNYLTMPGGQEINILLTFHNEHLIYESNKTMSII